MEPAGDRRRRALLLMLVAVTLALGWILQPLYGPILWACVIATLFMPVHLALQRRLRRGPTVCALLAVLMAVVIVIVPFAILSATLAREAMQVYAQAQSDQWDGTRYLRGLYDHLPTWVMAVLAHFEMTDFDTLQRQLTAAVAQGGQFIATHSLAIGQNTFGFVAELFLTVYLAFFLIRDGSVLLDAVRRALPLAADHKAELLAKFATVIRATVKGSLLVAAIQGLLGGLAFWALDMRAALLWGVLMAFLSLVLAVGAALVWLPVALFLLASAPLWQGLALLAWGLFVIGLADNLLRPLLVGKDTRLPDYVVMLTTLGGLAVFGINGFVIGPTIAALFMAVWHIQAVTQDASVP